MSSDNTRHVDELPTAEYLVVYMVLLAVGGLMYSAKVYVTSPATRKQTMKDLGVKLGKIGKTLKEIERKTFHLCGLLVPLIFALLLEAGFSRWFCSMLCWGLTVSGWTLDLCRLNVKWVKENFPLNPILREKEKSQLSGACYFSLGCTLAISFFPPAVAMTSILFLVLGDMSAALIGRSFGQDVVVVKLGREGKKSVEGSMAMFFMCCTLGFTVFSTVHLREYPVVIGATVATLTELYEPFGLNDNLTIPLLSSLALTWGFARVHNCERENPLTGPLLWYSHH
mmetsp:Transcript_5804/g.14072  ORF Transcript_5804/g.14072 Transcript_5804/m.14072 type:complete len:283 (-) Transcript_5804:297-1145(-)